MVYGECSNHRLFFFTLTNEGVPSVRILQAHQRPTHAPLLSMYCAQFTFKDSPAMASSRDTMRILQIRCDKCNNSKACWNLAMLLREDRIHPVTWEIQTTVNWNSKPSSCDWKKVWNVCDSRYCTCSEYQAKVWLWPLWNLCEFFVSTTTSRTSLLPKPLSTT